MVIYILLSILIFMSLLILFGSKGETSRFRNVKKVDISVLEKNRKSSKYLINARIEKITKKNKPLYKKIIDKIVILLMSRYANISTKKYVIISISVFLCGYIIGYKILNNIFIGGLLALVNLWVTYIFVEEYIKGKKREKDEKLLIVLSNLAATYINEDNFISAVEEIIDSIPAPLKDMFVIFLYKIKYYGFESIEGSMLELAGEVDNFYFTEFINLVIQAENGEAGLKYTIESIPEDYNEYIKINEEYRKIVADINLHFLLRVLLLPIAIGFTYFVGEEYFEILTQHSIGKLVLFGIFLAYSVAIYIFRKNNKDIILDI